MLSSSRNTTATTAAGISLEKSLHARSCVCVSSISIDICPNPCERLIDVKFVVTDLQFDAKIYNGRFTIGEREREAGWNTRCVYELCCIAGSGGIYPYAAVRSTTLKYTCEWTSNADTNQPSIDTCSTIKLEAKGSKPVSLPLFPWRIRSNNF